MASWKLVRWGGLAAILGGMLLVLKGAAIMVSAADPSLVPQATLLFATGMVGLHARLEGRAARHGRRFPRLGSARRLGGEPDRPGPLRPGSRRPRRPEAAYDLLHGGVLGYPGGAAGAGHSRLAREGYARTLTQRAVGRGGGVVPLQGVGFAISDGVGLVLGGLAWAVLGYGLWSKGGMAITQPSARVR